jgi:mannose-6-phosphate isomerase
MIDQIPSPTQVKKPWGKFEQYTHNMLSTVKVITVQPGGILSLQYHHRRDELWVILDSGTQVELEGNVLWPAKGERVFIPRGTVHRLSASGDGPIRVLEISFGEFDEDDIVRLEDLYGRVSTRPL